MGAPTRVCAGTGRELRTGDPFVAVLAQEAGSEDFVRLDYSPEGWSAAKRPLTLPDGRAVVVLGIWRGRTPEAGAKPRVFLDDASLVELFEQGLDEAERSPSEETRAFVFVLALILARKRLVVIERSDAEGMRVRVRGAGGGTYRVADPGLSEASIGRVGEMLESVLAGSDGGVEGAVGVTAGLGAGAQGTAS